jgi:hypothetical protein
MNLLAFVDLLYDDGAGWGLVVIAAILGVVISWLKGDEL